MAARVIKAKIGDVFAMETRKGYRLYQCVSINEEMGSNMNRALPNFYPTIPDNIHELVNEKQSFTFYGFNQKADFAKLVGNYPVPEWWEHPKYSFVFWNRSNVWWISEELYPNRRFHKYEFHGDETRDCLPEVFKDVDLIGLVLTRMRVIVLMERDYCGSSMDFYLDQDDEALLYYVNKYKPNYRISKAIAPFVWDEYDNECSVSLYVGEEFLAESFEKYELLPNGYGWEALLKDYIKKYCPEIEDKIMYDCEADNFHAYVKKKNKKVLQELIKAFRIACDDIELIEGLLAVMEEI